MGRRSASAIMIDKQSGISSTNISRIENVRSSTRKEDLVSVGPLSTSEIISRFTEVIIGPLMPDLGDALLTPFDPGLGDASILTPGVESYSHVAKSVGKGLHGSAGSRAPAGRH